MKFIDVTINNFMSFKEQTVTLHDRGLVLICGVNNDDESFDSNGSGKSAILESIVWCLFGKTLRNINADDVVNHKTKKNTSVFLTIEKDGDQYQISRYRKSSKYQNKVFLYKNDEELTLGTNKQTQDLIEDIIGIDYGGFTSSVIFGHGFGDFFTSTTDSVRKEILERILELGVFSKCHSIVKEELKTKTALYEKIKSNYDNFLSKQNDLKNDIDWFNNEIEEYYKRMDAERVRIKGLMLDSRDESNELKKIHTNIEKELSLVEDVLSGFAEPKKNEVSELLNKVNGQLIAVGEQKKVLLDSIEALEQKILDIKSSYVGNPCPTCGRVVTEAQLPTISASVTENIAEKNRVLVSLRKRSDELVKECDRLEKETDDSNEQVIEEFNKLNVKRRALVQEKERISSKMSKLKAEMVNALEDLQRLEEKKDLDPLLNGLKGKERELEEVADKAGSVKEELSEIEKGLPVLEFWHTGFSNQGIKSWVINSYIPFLNERIDYYLSSMGFYNIDMKLSPVVSSRKGAEVDKIEVVFGNEENYYSYSSGERRRLDLAVLFALQDLVSNNNPFNLLFYDEVFDTLDESGCEYVVELLRTRKSDTVFVISHNDNLKSYFDEVITVTKENGISFI